jgi:hypothetical protein
MEEARVAQLRVAQLRLAVARSSAGKATVTNPMSKILYRLLNLIISNRLFFVEAWQVHMGYGPNFLLLPSGDFLVCE